MRNGIAGIDHAIVAVRDLDRARMGWTRLGFTLTPRGCHLGQAECDHCECRSRAPGRNISKNQASHCATQAAHQRERHY